MCLVIFQTPSTSRIRLFILPMTFAVNSPGLTAVPSDSSSRWHPGLPQSPSLRNGPSNLAQRFPLALCLTRGQSQHPTNDLQGPVCLTPRHPSYTSSAFCAAAPPTSSNAPHPFPHWLFAEGLSSQISIRLVSSPPPGLGSKAFPGDPTISVTPRQHFVFPSLLSCHLSLTTHIPPVVPVSIVYFPVPPLEGELHQAGFVCFVHCNTSVLTTVPDT